MATPFRTTIACGGLVAIVVLAGCQRGHSVATNHPAAVAATFATSPSPPPRTAPDFGGITTKHVEVTATGPTLRAAVDNAIRLGIQQINGERADTTNARLDTGLSLRSGDNQVSVDSKAYADLVRTATSGAVTNFQILSQKQTNAPVSQDKESLKASSGASWSSGNVDAAANASAFAGAAPA